MPVAIPVHRLAKHCNPFSGHPWAERVTRRDVRRALAEGRLAATPGTGDHAGRIAFLMTHEATDPIDIDVGVPAFGCHVRWFVQDGNHRLAAAIMAGRPTISALVGGQLDYAKRLFGVECAEPEPRLGVPRP